MPPRKPPRPTSSSVEQKEKRQRRRKRRPPGIFLKNADSADAAFLDANEAITDGYATTSATAAPAAKK